MKVRCTTECAEDFKRLTDEKTAVLMAAVRRGDFRWLIEAPGQNYLGARHLGDYNFFWTQDHNAALAFREETQADMTMMAVRQLAPALFGFESTLGNAKAVEHGWMAHFPLLVSAERLAEQIASDPDIDCEAGGPPRAHSETQGNGS